MKDSVEFIPSYKKVLIFGSQNSGKTSLVKRLEKGIFSEETHTEDGKFYIIYNL